MIKIGIIGGSGLDDPDILVSSKKISVETPYGQPTSDLTIGQISEVPVVLISRHGTKHQFSPAEVNYRANIHAMKEQGVTHIIATTACGSLQEKIGRGDFVIIDQFIDFTRFRQNTFFTSFKNGIHHTPMADPFDQMMRDALYQAGSSLGYRIFNGGTVITIEGPRFSTRAESKMFRTWGADVINMSIATEACLANDAEIPYAVVAMSTDYDCWKEDEPPVSWEDVFAVFEKNAENVKKLIIKAIPDIYQRATK